MDEIRKIMNFRDLGGYPTKDGRKIKTGLLYRSAALGYMTQRELEVIQELHIRTILDLRSKKEIFYLEDPVLPNINQISVDAMIDRSDERMGMSSFEMFRTGLLAENKNKVETLVKSYYSEVPFNNPAFDELFRILLDHETPILFHCAQGKDRTGIAAMLILLALGVDDETIVKDYMMTNEYLKQNITRQKNNFRFLTKHSRNVRDLLTVGEGVIEAGARSLLQAIRLQYSSDEEFFEQEYHLAEDDILTLRQFYLE